MYKRNSLGEEALHMGKVDGEEEEEREEGGRGKRRKEERK